jgi:hypothetical protein
MASKPLTTPRPRTPQVRAGNAVVSKSDLGDPRQYRTPKYPQYPRARVSRSSGSLPRPKNRSTSSWSRGRGGGRGSGND